MISFEHQITRMKLSSVGDLFNVVREIEWKILATDGDFSFQFHHSSLLSDPDPDLFIQFESLTEEQALSWLGDPLSESMRFYLEEQIEKQRKESLLVSTDPPWTS